jgi:hypothetical protein
MNLKLSSPSIIIYIDLISISYRFSDSRFQTSNAFFSKLWNQFFDEIVWIILSRRYITNDFIKVRVFWDKKCPLITCIETAVMLFVEYLCYYGGLLGLWFGSKAFQIISYVMDSRNWISLKYILKNFCRILITMIGENVNILLNFISNFRIRLYIEW